MDTEGERRRDPVEYVKIEEIANAWGISTRRVQNLCAQGRVEGAVRFGRDWMIPKDAKRPADGRTKASRQEPPTQPLEMPRKTPFLHMTDLYHAPGKADECAAALEGNEEAKMLFEAEVAYSRGQIDRVYACANYLLERNSGFYAVLSAGMLLALCAIWRGDLQMWRKAKQHMAHAHATNDQERDIILLSITAVDSMLYDVSSFPEWFKIGCFDPLHKDSMPAARIFYAKYLYAAAYAIATRELEVEGLKGLTLMGMLPYTFEPMISQSKAEGCVMAEAYLRMICATVYHNSGNKEQTVRHIDRAIELALPDRLYGFLAEYGRVLGPQLESRLNAVDPEVWPIVKNLYKTYHEGWTKLSGSVRGKTLITTLSAREREVAKLAAFGMQNSEIAERLHMSLSGVKQAVRIVSEKTGVSRDEFAAFL